MILSDRDIEALMEDGELVITPITDYDLQLQPASFDVHLSDKFRKVDPGVTLDMKEGIPEDKTTQFTVEDKYVLEPGEYILGSTVERVEIPNGYVCRVEGRSSIGRLAVDVHATAGFVDPGFEGQITLEISNKTQDNPVTLRPHRRFAQLVFEATLSKSREHYGEKEDGKYQNQNDPTPSRIHEDIENE